MRPHWLLLPGVRVLCYSLISEFNPFEPAKNRIDPFSDLQESREFKTKFGTSAISRSDLPPVLGDNETVVVVGDRDMYCFRTQPVIPDVLVPSAEKQPPTWAHMAALLGPLYGTCTYMQSGWWTFEVCHKKHVRQFHGGAASEDYESFSLGTFDPVSSADQAQPAGKAVHTADSVIEHKYTGGDRCDLNTELRRSAVRFRCNPYGPTQLRAVREVETCVYVLEVDTPLICVSLVDSDRRRPSSTFECQWVVSDAAERPPPPLRPSWAAELEELRSAQKQAKEALLHTFLDTSKDKDDAKKQKGHKTETRLDMSEFFRLFEDAKKQEDEEADRKKKKEKKSQK